MYRALFDDQRADEVLFTVEAEYGTADRVRLATLTDYDGEVLRPGDDLHFVRMPSARAIGDENRVAAQVTIEGQRGIWLPTIGEVSEVVFDGDRAADLGTVSTTVRRLERASNWLRADFGRASLTA